MHVLDLFNDKDRTFLEGTLQNEGDIIKFPNKKSVRSIGPKNPTNGEVVSLKTPPKKQVLTTKDLASISDRALDRAYGYGRSVPGPNFGWLANMNSAMFAKRIIDSGETDIDRIAAEVHKGWATAAIGDYKNKLPVDPPTPEETKLRRLRLAQVDYNSLPEKEKEKDRVVARALLQAITGQATPGADVNEGDVVSMPTRPQTEPVVNVQPATVVPFSQFRDPGTRRLEMWKQKVRDRYPEYGNRIRFVSKDNGQVVSAEIPGVDRSFGVFDLTTEKGQVLDESGLQYYTGVKKYGKEGMKKLAAAGRKGASQEELGRIKDQHIKKEDAGVEEGLRDPKDNPCWKGYHPVGTKKKNGRTVPNCVPNANEDVAEDDNFKKPAAMMKGSPEALSQAQDIVQKQADKNIVGQAKIAGAIPNQGVAEGFKNTYNVGDRVDGPLGTGTIVAVSKNINVDGRVKVKLDDPSRAGEDGKYKDSFVLDTTQLKHISEQGVAESSDELYGLRVGDTVKAVVNGKRVQGDVIDIFPETMKVELLLRGGNAGKTVTVDVRDTEALSEQGVAEGSLAEGQYEMMMRNGQVKKFIAKDDADAKRIAAGHGAKSVIRLRGGVPAGKVTEQGVAEGPLHNPGREESPVTQAITRRILLQRTDLLAKYGPEKVSAAIDEVADFVGDVDEIGSSDVSGWVAQVDRLLKTADGQGLNEVSDEMMINYLTKVHQDAMKHIADPSKRSAEKRNKSVAGFNRAFNKLDARPGAQKDAEQAQALAPRVSEEGENKKFEPMDHRDYIKQAEELHNQYMSASQRNDKEAMRQLKAERDALDAQAKKGLRENEKEGRPRIRKYSKMRPDGSKAVRYEVLDYRGMRVPGQGPEGFDDLKYAKEFYYNNYDKLQSPVEEQVQEAPAEEPIREVAGRYWCKNEKRWKNVE